MHQATAEIISNEKILERLTRPCVPPQPRPRDILGSWLMWIRCPDIANSVRPGQFVMAKCGDETLLRRPLGVHGVQGDNMALFFAAWEDGAGTMWLSERKAGDKVDLVGPLGNGFTIEKNASNMLLVAGGTGIAPIIFLGERAIEQGKSVTLLYGACCGTQLYSNRLLPPGMKYVTAAEDGLMCHKKGRVTDLIPEYVCNADQIFACGPVPMYQTIARQGLLAGKPCQVSLEVRMGCGFGLCYGCTIKTKRGLKQVCKDGPIFGLDDVIWDGLVGI